MAAGGLMDRLGGLYFLNRDAGYRADASALVAADAVFGEKIEPVVAIFGYRSFFVGIGEGYTPPRSGPVALQNGSRSPPDRLHKVP